eukprot:Blabericola_migrator_1__11673@NODE_703_length_6798_cov_75_067301_g511_i0_p2_GENE_NODE_703_length_6798_cov_75_067301_g511_i0NODE_703_length_6798_cov_75_067301_g511_i0_p2_ORF_typecomplete_len487_score27_64zfRING_2/PF13639_6/5_1e11zfRING_11/PF17123_5/1e07zfC3HC4_2/PF13923_6/1_9e06zfrbx1/PF12678_7/9_7e05zfC3HC4/PF00097_25/0_00023Zn_ribbon_17/PF17120_5/2_4e03Zn_ribbon_17/PF17120_5/0_0046ProkRING_4/PF14447_6/8_8e02ProkRING_4/PF14447_6/0_006zfRING_5/PF14634_6/5_8e03zfRING_5/PF14634_6/0_0095zfRING_UBOX/
MDENAVVGRRIQSSQSEGSQDVTGCHQERPEFRADPLTSSSDAPLARSESTSDALATPIEVHTTVPSSSNSTPTTSRCTLCSCRRRLRTVKDIFMYPVKLERWGACPPPFTISPQRAIKYLDAFHGIELIDASSQLVVISAFLFHVLRIPPSDIRERLMSWITVLVTLLTSRCIFLALILEQGRTVFQTSSVRQLRSNIIVLLYSSKMAAARWLYVCHVLWFLLGWDIFATYKQYKKYRDQVPPEVQALYRERLVASRFRGPPASHDPLETMAVELLGYLLMGSVIMGFIHVIWLSLTTVYLYYRKHLSFPGWTSILGADTPEPWVPIRVEAPRQQVPTEVLDSFPTVVWDRKWSSKNGSTESLGSQSETCCAVCLLSFEHGDTTRILPCCHLFHQSCIDIWLGAHQECPLRCAVNLTQVFNGDFGDVVLQDRLPLGLVNALRANIKSTSNSGANIELVSTNVSPSLPNVEPRNVLGRPQPTGTTT